jgi:RNA polymerase sigma factor (TIGR02999 family)
MKDRSELFNQLYEQLRRLAHNRLFNENGPKDATSLVHEAYLKLRTWDASFQSDEHFLSTASKVMRQILVDRGRARSTQKREGKMEPLSVSLDGLAHKAPNFVDVLILNELLDRFEALDPRAVQITEMHIFLGLNEQEIAASLRISERTVKRDWAAAKAWLKAELGAL